MLRERPGGGVVIEAVKRHAVDNLGVGRRMTVLQRIFFKRTGRSRVTRDSEYIVVIEQNSQASGLKKRLLNWRFL